MEWWTLALAILLPTVLVSSIFLVILRSQRRKIKQLLEQAQSAEIDNRNAIWAGATILSAQQETGVDPSTGQVRVRLQMRVTGHGGDPYNASAVWLVDDVHLPQTQPGAEVSVKVNRDHPNLVYPNMPGMQAASRTVNPKIL